MLPHLLNRDAGAARSTSVLIIGAGSGNDVAAALPGGVDHVDAVEIDPVTQRDGPGAIIPTSPTTTRRLDPPRRRPQLRPQDRPDATT